MSEKTFCGVVPEGLLYDPRTDMWVRRRADGSLLIGATSFGLFLAGEIIAFTPKPAGAVVAALRGFGTVETGKTVLAVRSPISLKLVASNDAAEENPALINDDPYASGWMIRAEASDWAAERTLLVDAAAYRAHCLAVDPTATVDIVPSVGLSG
jgi:glycine cleavage system H protein